MHINVIKALRGPAGKKPIQIFLMQCSLDLRVQGMLYHGVSISIPPRELMIREIHFGKHPFKHKIFFLIIMTCMEYA